MKTGDTLTITVSKGKGVKVPDITSMSKSDIEDWCKKNSISCTIKTNYSNSDKAVLASNVSAGTTIAAGDDIEITMNAGKYFYASDEGLKDVLYVGGNVLKVEDWCNEKRHIGIDSYVGDWSGSAEVYSEVYSKGQIVSYEISSYTNGGTYDINERLPLDARFSIVVSKGKFYKETDLFEKWGSGVSESEAASISDVIEVLSSKGISYVLDSSVSSHDQKAWIDGITNDEFYDDHTYTIKVADGSYMKLKTSTTSTSGSDDADDTK